MANSPDGKPYSIDFYEENGGKPVLVWIKNDLTADQRKVLGTAMSEILQEQGSDVCESEFGKWVDADIFYFRLRTETGDIFRVYCHQYEGTVILLLHGYDKGGRTAKSWETAQQRIAGGRLNGGRAIARCLPNRPRRQQRMRGRAPAKALHPLARASPNRHAGTGSLRVDGTSASS